jgi:hypothetical protein
VSLGVDHDTTAFAVTSIRQWWLKLGRARYPEATRLLITAGSGRNDSRVGEVRPMSAIGTTQTSRSDR